MLIFKIICIIGLIIVILCSLFGVYIFKKAENESENENEQGIYRSVIYGAWIEIAIITAALMYIIMI